jgi:polysaccharide export outer membrane protein
MVFFSSPRTLLLLAALIFCMACGARGPKVTTDIDRLKDAPAESGNSLEVAELNKQLYASFTATPSYEDYVIGGGDLVRSASSR